MINLLSRVRVAFSLAGLFVVVVALLQKDERLMWVAIGLLSGSVVARLLLRRAIRERDEQTAQE